MSGNAAPSAGVSPRARMSARTWLTLILVCLGGYAIGQFVRDRGAGAATDIGARTDLSRIRADSVSPSSGPADARVTLVAFTDYQCPACRAAHPHMRATVHAAGDVRVIYRDLPIFGPVSQQAARVALAARNQGLYEQVHDAFMREPRRLDPPVLRAIVEQQGGDWARIERDLASDPAIERQLALNRADALKLGVSGTPSYLAGPYLAVGGRDEDGFAALIAKARDAPPD